jgi:hypothetical protein
LLRKSQSHNVLFLLDSIEKIELVGLSRLELLDSEFILSLLTTLARRDSVPTPARGNQIKRSRPSFISICSLVLTYPKEKQVQRICPV